MQRNFLEELKYQWKHGGMHIRLIGINIIVYVFINLGLTFGDLLTPRGGKNPMESFMQNFFTLHGDIPGFLSHPWGIFTSIFAHFGFWHLAFNMIFLYFIGRYFLMYFSNQRMSYTYILGGLLGGIFQLVAYAIFPALHGIPSFVVGASGAVMAVFMAAAFYRPMAEVYLFGMVKVKMIWIALFFFLSDLFQMSSDDNVAHFAHLGGAVFGFWSIYKISEKSNVVTIFQNLIESIKRSFEQKEKVKMRTKINKEFKAKTANSTDEEYNLRKKKKQEKIDAILDKIAKSGYDSLTKEEKALLFEQSRDL